MSKLQLNQLQNITHHGYLQYPSFYITDINEDAYIYNHKQDK